METKAEPKAETEAGPGEVVLLAEIQAWTIILRNAQSQAMVARRALVRLGVKLKPAQFVRIVDESPAILYNENVERANSKPPGS